MEPEVRPLDGHWLVRNLKHALENQLIQKEHVIKASDSFHYLILHAHEKSVWLETVTFMVLSQVFGK